MIDIGPRLMDMATLTEILKRLNILDEQGGGGENTVLAKDLRAWKKISPFDE